MRFITKFHADSFHGERIGGELYVDRNNREKEKNNAMIEIGLSSRVVEQAVVWEHLFYLY